MKHRLLSGIQVDDLLADWSWYCERNGMALGCRPDETTHAVLVVADGRECRVNIRGSACPAPEDTLNGYLTDWQRRHPDSLVELVETEEELRGRCGDGEHVGFILQILV